jgi:hypothetical protein
LYDGAELARGLGGGGGARLSLLQQLIEYIGETLLARQAGT